MNKEIYRRAKEFKRKYPMTIAFRLRAHAKIVSKFIGSDEEIKYVFVAQKNYQSYEIINTNIIVLTDKRLVVATKRLVFGYFLKVITPDMFNDLTIKQGPIWGKVIIDTVKEEVILSNIDRNALAEIDDNITMTMIEEKKEYGFRVGRYLVNPAGRKTQKAPEGEVTKIKNAAVNAGKGTYKENGYFAVTKEFDRLLELGISQSSMEELLKANNTEGALDLLRDLAENVKQDPEFTIFKKEQLEDK